MAEQFQDAVVAEVRALTQEAGGSVEQIREAARVTGELLNMNRADTAWLLSLLGLVLQRRDEQQAFMLVMAASTVLGEEREGDEVEPEGGT